MFLPVHDLNGFKGGVNSRLSFVRPHAQVEQRELDIFIYRQFIDQVKALKNKANVAFSELGSLSLRQLGYFRTHEFELTFGWIVE